MNDFFETVPYNHSVFPIYIQKEVFCASVPFTSHINWHDDIEFVKILSGEITYNINGNLIRLSKGQCLFINANQLHYSFFCENNDCELICVIFQPSLLGIKKHYEEHYILPILSNRTIPYYIFRDEVPWEREIIHHIQTIYDICPEEEFELFFYSVFFKMWADIYMHLGTQKKIAASDTEAVIPFKKMLSFIQHHYKEKISLADICSVGNVCKTTCNKIFKTYTGRTPIEYLTDHRLRRAIDLMQNKDITLIEICYECGFSGASYFAETFKKAFGISPKKYKVTYKTDLTDIFT